MENDVIVTTTESSNELQNGITHADVGEAFVSSFISEDPDHLEHYGIKGMKWGVRRYQNKDGSLTKAGLKRYGSAVAEAGKKVGKVVGEAARATTNKISEKHSQRKEEKRVEKLMSKPIRKLTEEERIERMDRKMKERELLNLEKNVKELRESDKSKGRKFVEDMVTKVAIPSVLNAGEKQLTAFLNKKLGDAFGLGDKKTTLIKELIEGTKKITDLSDQEFNTVGKGAENWGNFTKNVLGKNTDQDGGPTTTLFRDIMSGKIKMEDLNDSDISKAGKSAEAVANVKKQMPKDSGSDTQSDSKPKTDANTKSETKAEAKTETKTESKTESKSDTDSANKTEDKTEGKTDTSNKSDFSNYKMKSVEEMNNYGPVKTGKSKLSELHDSGYTMRSVEDIEKSSSVGIGQSYVVRELYSSGYRMAPIDDK